MADTPSSYPRGHHPNSRAALQKHKKPNWKPGESGMEGRSRPRLSLETLVNKQLDAELQVEGVEESTTKRKALAMVLVNEMVVHRNVAVIGLVMKFMPKVFEGLGEDLNGVCVTCQAVCGHCHPPEAQDVDVLNAEAETVLRMLGEAGFAGKKPKPEGTNGSGRA